MELDPHDAMGSLEFSPFLPIAKTSVISLQCACLQPMLGVCKRQTLQPLCPRAASRLPPCLTPVTIPPGALDYAILQDNLHRSKLRQVVLIEQTLLQLMDRGLCSDHT